MLKPLAFFSPISEGSKLEIYPVRTDIKGLPWVIGGCKPDDCYLNTNVYVCLMLRFKRIREYENFHILLWLIKDTCWLMIWEVAGLIMIVPTIAAAIHITWIRRKIKTDLFHNLAVCFWISGNSIWMIGEFFYADTLRPPAMIFFAAGLIVVLYYYIIDLPNQSRKLSKKGTEK